MGISGRHSATPSAARVDIAHSIHRPLKRSRNTDHAEAASGLPRRESWKLRSTSPETTEPGSIMFAVIPRAYIRSALEKGETSPRPRAITDQRSADTRLLRIATATAALKSQGLTPAS